MHGLSKEQIAAIRIRVQGNDGRPRDKRIANPVKNHGQNQGGIGNWLSKRLSARIGDWDRTMNDPANRSKTMTGYNKPGSMAR